VTKIERKGGNYLLTGPGETILDIGAKEAMDAWDAWFVVVIILLGVGLLTLDRYDVWRVLACIAFGWLVLGALLLGYRGEHL
jgi:hypothetical protein